MRILVIIFCIVINSASAQVPPWSWATGVGGSANDELTAMATDPGGNVYATGYFQSASITIGSTTLVNPNSSINSYLVKFDASGTMLWASNIGGTGGDLAWAVATDGFGNVYVAGSYNSPSLILGSDTLINAGLLDIYLVKYNGAGTVAWAKSIGGNAYDVPKTVVTDAAGNVCIAGNFNSNSLTLGSATLINQGDDDMFIARFDSTGLPLWATGVGSVDNEVPYSLCADALGNIYCCGSFLSPSVNFDTITLTNVGNPLTWDIFLVKYTPSGNVAWAKSAGGSYYDFAKAVAIDGSGHVYVTGTFFSSTLALDTLTLTNNGARDMFLVQYDTSGTLLWANGFGGADIEEGLGLCTDQFDNVYVAGFFQTPTFTLGSFTLTNVTTPPSTTYDLFAASFDMTGTVRWATSTGGAGIDEAISIVCDGASSLYAGGYYTSSNIPFGSTVLTNANIQHDFFVARMALATGIHDPSPGKFGLEIFPNPILARSLLHIETIRPGLLMITDITGKTILREMVSEKGLDIHCNFSPGMYLIRFEDEKQSVTRKLFVND